MRLELCEVARHGPSWLVLTLRSLRFDNLDAQTNRRRRAELLGAPSIMRLACNALLLRAHPESFDS